MGTCVQVPVASQTSWVQSFPSSVHAVPAGSSRQRAEQQTLPSSQFSRGSITPFPHLVRMRVPEIPQLREVKVPVISSPSPVPLYAKS